MTNPQAIRLIHPVGRGGSATVWAGYHQGLSRMVAVKRISARQLRKRPQEGERLRREAMVIARLRSPHVVRVLAHARRRKAAYLVMEWLTGETLDTHLVRHGPMSLGRVEAMVRQVASVLSEAHGLGFVHRDIKPSNLFVLDDGRETPTIKVIDFGIVGCLDEQDDPLAMAKGNILGSPPYMSPEQYRGEARVDTRIDLWSLAVVAYRALTGRRPFDGRGLVEMASAILAGEVIAPSRLRPGLGADVDLWFARALHRDVRLRFQTPAALASSFSAIARRQVEPATLALDAEAEGRRDGDTVELSPDEGLASTSGARPTGPRPFARATPTRLATVA